MRQCSPMAVIHPDGSTSSLEVDFALALLSGIELAKKDPAQLRHIVYELARVWLEGELTAEARARRITLREPLRDAPFDAGIRGCNRARRAIFSPARKAPLPTGRFA